MINTSSRIVEVANGFNSERKEYKPDLCKKEFDILLYFLKNRNTVISRHLLIRDLWSWPARISDKTVDKHVEKLRNKLKSAGKKIEAVFGIGYRFNDN